MRAVKNHFNADPGQKKVDKGAREASEETIDELEPEELDEDDEDLELDQDEDEDEEEAD